MVPSFARRATLSLALLTMITIGGTSLLSANAPRPESGLVVHEWGTFTSVAGQDGVTLEWRPLAFESDLPSFVHSVDKGSSAPPQTTEPRRPQPNPAAPPQPQPSGLRYPTKSGMTVSVRMETPVLYFYSKEETAVTVAVDFRGGKITEWYPQARSVSGGNIEWGKIKVMPGAHVDLPNDFRENHYYPARDTDAAPIQVSRDQRTEHEKFLFYRGVGDFDLPLAVRIEGDKVAVKNAHGDSVCKLILFENRGGKVGYQIRDMPQTEVMLDRPALDGKVEGLREEMKAMLISQGLYEKEADAMLNTWRDSWFEEGLRVFYIMPRKTTDAILPIVIHPEPVELVRVLVGRTEIITPEIVNGVTTQITKLRDPSINVRKTALKEINKYGRFREFILTQVLSHTKDPQIKMGVARLLEQMN